MIAGMSAAVVLAMAAIAGGSVPRLAGDDPGGISPRSGAVSRALRAFAADDLTGRRWTAADLRGRVVLIDFWATWCAPCLADLPRLKALRAKHRRADFEIVGISLDVKSRRSFVSWLNRNRIDWPQIHERAGYNGDLPRLFAVDRLPRTILVGRDGRVVAVDLRGEDLAARIDGLVAADPAPAGAVGSLERRLPSPPR